MKYNPLIPELLCSDLNRSLEFYCDVLGLSVVYDRMEDKFAFLEINGAQLMLQEYSGGVRSWVNGYLENPYGRGMNLQIEVTGIDIIYKRIEADSIFMSIENKWYRVAEKFLGNRQFIITDPDGYLLRFFEDLGFKNNL